MGSVNIGMEKYKIAPDSVQATLLVPLVGRKWAGEKYPDLIQDPSAARILEQIDYDRSTEDTFSNAMGLYGALEAAQRVYDLEWEVRDYLQAHPQAAVVNMGCGLDDLFSRVDNGQCRGYNIDFADNIEVRNALLPAQGRERNLASDLNDTAWFDAIDASRGAVFVASGVFYYFTREAAEKLFAAMAERFPGGVLVFDICNAIGLKMMLSTWIKQAEIQNVGAYFSVADPQKELAGLSSHFESVSAKSYMRGYRDLQGLRLLYRFMNWLADHMMKMRIIKISFS